MFAKNFKYMVFDEFRETPNTRIVHVIVMCVAVTVCEKNKRCVLTRVSKIRSVHAKSAKLC